MKPNLLLLFFLFSFLSNSFSSSNFPINIWPKPTKIKWPIPLSSNLSPSLTIISSHPPHRHLSLAISRYSNLLLSDRYHPLISPSIPSSYGSISSLSISISDPSASLHHNVDESYNLSIPLSGTAHLLASTPWAAIRGLESFSQLAWSSESQILIAAGIEIADRPLFPHRGLLLDTSRNFFRVEDIMRTVRAMGHNKMNVLHWHVTDSQSFPILLPSVPELAIEGAYGKEMRYEEEDVRRIVDYAMSFGVRVMPEIDVPGEFALTFISLFLKV